VTLGANVVDAAVPADDSELDLSTEESGVNLSDISDVSAACSGQSEHRGDDLAPKLLPSARGVCLPQPRPDFLRNVCKGRKDCPTS